MKSLGRKLFDICLSIFLFCLGFFVLVCDYILLMSEGIEPLYHLIGVILLLSLAFACWQKAVSLLYYLNVSDEERAMRHDGKLFLLGLLAGLLWNNRDK